MSLDPVALAQALIRRPSVTPADAGAMDVLQAALDQAGFTCRRLRFGEIENLYARRGDTGPNLCFAGHTDVVPAGDTAAWSAPPFAGAVTGGLLQGRGAVDMKGAIAAFVAAAAATPTPTGSLSLLITGDEEGVATDGTVRVVETLAAEGERIDHCVVGEPTSSATLGDTIKIGRRGSLTGRLTVRGIQGHVAYPDRADNPIRRLLAMLASVDGQLDAGTPHFPPSNLEPVSVDVGNPASNVIPATARAVFNVRFNDLWTAKTLEAHLRAAFDRLAPAQYALECSVSGEAFLTSPGPFTGCVARAIKAATGVAPGFGTGGGTSDARFIRATCPVVEFGLPGATMHQVDEAVAVADIHALARAYRAIVDAVFGFEGELA